MGAISKMFNSTMVKHLTDLCISYIISHQRGFVKGRSTVTMNLLFFIDDNMVVAAERIGSNFSKLSHAMNKKLSNGVIEDLATLTRDYKIAMFNC